MFGNTKKNNVRGLALRFRRDEYYDFMIYKGETYSGLESDVCIAADFDAIFANDTSWESTILWDNSSSDNITLKNIGFTGIDNGLISFQKDRITNKEFLDVFTGSTFIPNQKLTLYSVKSNTKKYDYSFDICDDYIKLSGGFYQVFYKIFDKRYQLLPNTLDSDWNLSFVLRRKNYEVNDNILNKKYPNNSGIFFYMGLRSENKFARYYNGGDDVLRDIDDIDFMIDDISLKGLHIETENGFDVKSNKEYDVHTDNKHVFFNRTSSGFTTDTWDDEYDVYAREEKKYNNDVNLFELMNRTSTGYTTETIEGYLESINPIKYNIFNDLKENAFALKINEDGSIGYRYCISDCEGDNGVSFIEEYSNANIVLEDEWYSINVRVISLSDKTMKLWFYVGGNLILISKELPKFNFRPLNDVADKQEGVPYNISLGGGTQGLSDGVWLDYYEGYEFNSPLANNFAGTFIGDIKSFKFYNCFMDYSRIKENNI